MFTLFLLLLIFTLFAGVGLLVYDYLRYKKDTTDKLTDEISKRTENDTSLEKQVNSSFDKVYGMFSASNVQFTSNLEIVEAKAGTQEKNLDAFIKGFGQVARISDGTGANIPISTLEKSEGVDMNLLGHVSMVSGMTARDLEAGKNQIKLCNKDKTCIEIPDIDGNTRLRTMVPGKSVIMEGNAHITGNLTLGPEGTMAKRPGFMAEDGKLTIEGESVRMPQASIEGNEGLKFFTSTGQQAAILQPFYNSFANAGLRLRGGSIVSDRDVTAQRLMLTDTRGISVASVEGGSDGLYVKLLGSGKKIYVQDSSTLPFLAIENKPSEVSLTPMAGKTLLLGSDVKVTGTVKDSTNKS